MSHWERFDVRHQEMMLADPDYDSPLWCAIKDIDNRISKIEKKLQSLQDRQLVDGVKKQVKEIGKL